jgi:iron complex outermembrane receptor protein
MSDRILQLITFCFSVIFTTGVMAQTGNIKGNVKTSDRQPAGFVNIVVKGTNKGGSTNANGEYFIRNIEAGAHILSISFVGLETREQNIEVRSGETIEIPSVVLVENSRQLSEIVVIDFRTNPYDKNESDYVARMPLNDLENAQAYSTITKELLVNQMIFSVDDAVKNAPGLQKMWEATGRGGDGGAYYNSRGFILQSQLRNGVAGNVTSRIDAANVERIEVIKGPSATLFGSTLTSYGGLINRVTKKPYEGSTPRRTGTATVP